MMITFSPVVKLWVPLDKANMLLVGASTEYSSKDEAPLGIKILAEAFPKKSLSFTLAPIRYP